MSYDGDTRDDILQPSHSDNLKACPYFDHGCHKSKRCKDPSNDQDRVVFHPSQYYFWKMSMVVRFYRMQKKYAGEKQLIRSCRSLAAASK